MRLALVALAGAGLALSACSTTKDALYGPKLTEMSSPAIAASMQSSAPVIASTSAVHQPGAVVPVASANSLWRPGARAFFDDQRANKPGDILTVLISIDDRADMSNSTETSRDTANNAGITNFFGLEAALGKFLPSEYDPASMINQKGASSSKGEGTVRRQERINLTMAAVVTGVLPNGNLIIQGSQQVRTNSELRDLTVVGIVRPQDISSSNTVRHTQIAEARISYGGRGDLTRVQRTPAGQALLQSFSPF